MNVDDDIPARMAALLRGDPWVDVKLVSGAFVRVYRSDAHKSGFAWPDGILPGEWLWWEGRVGDHRTNGTWEYEGV